jgi:DMSO/TMAO reductase YedYZ molybdopterin-dependent catalytic subunit
VLRERVVGLINRLEPHPRLVDYSILVLVLLEAITGIVSLGAGFPGNWPVFEFHRLAGFTLVALLFYKLRRVRHRVTTRKLWDRATVVSVLLAVVALTTLGLGVFWALGGDVRVWFWTALNVHIGLGLLLVPLVVFHVLARAKPIRGVEFAERRAAIQYSALLIGGALAVRGQEAVSALTGTAGRYRRFTGSKPVDATVHGDGEVGDRDLPSAVDDPPADGETETDTDTTGDGDRDAGNGSFPVTSWVADDPDPVDVTAWRLRVDGLVDEPRAFRFEELPVGEQRRALLDCTSGWYTIQDWRGVRVGDLLAAAGVADDAAWVTVHSVTGYRWSYPIAEAREFLLATEVGGDRLSHGHGAPLRLVAPDRRGFQWVKWVDRVEVRRSRDLAQYVATLLSGFD